MPEYTVQWNYKTDKVGPFTEGSTVHLSVEEAEAINRDSPGVLVEVETNKPKKKRADRAVKADDAYVKTRNTADLSKQDEITRKEFKAVVDKD